MQQQDTYYRKLLVDFIENRLPEQDFKELWTLINDFPEKYLLLMDEPAIHELLEQKALTGSDLLAEDDDIRIREKLMGAIQTADSPGQQADTDRPGTQKDNPDKKGEPDDLGHGQIQHIWKYAAAAVLLCAVLAVVFWGTRQSGNVIKTETAKTSLPAGDIPPGKKGAVLTLADGSQVVLDSMNSGLVASQGGTKVVLDNGQLNYDVATGQGQPVYNTMTTPNGRQFRLSLPDGTEVWLNSASSITFPTSFAGNERTVSVTGETYFEVTKDKTRPFHVKVSGMEVEVLGTHFNINAYTDEAAIKTTLLEGSVKIRRDGNSLATLVPGQQAQYAGAAVRVSDANIEQVMAWKNGVFDFNGADLQTVARQLMRWYNISVKYEGNLPERRFLGKLPQDLNLSQVLRIFKEVEISCRLEGQTLILSR